MNKVINGKRYNTLTAKEVDSVVYGGRGDFDFLREALYKKRTGEYFLYCEGGAATVYGKTCEDGSRMFDDRIIPLKPGDEKLWMEDPDDFRFYRFYWC